MRLNDKIKNLYKDKKVRLNVYFDEVQQASDIVREIDELISSKECPIDEESGEKLYSEIAILSTSNDELANYAELLHNRNIPYELKEGKSIFDIKSSMILYYYLQTLVNPDAYSDKIFRLLLLPPFNISPESYAMLCNENSKHKNFISAIQEIVKSKQAPEDIKNFILTYENLRKTMLAGETVYRVVAQCAAKTGILDFFFNLETNKLENTLALKRLLDEAYTYSGQYKKVNLEDFVEYLNMIQAENQTLNIEKDSEKMDAVQLTTYQSSKGLEYEYVYMPSLKPRKWESSSKPIIKPPIPLSKEDQRNSDTWESFKQADKINKMYVGMTRAKHTLRLSYVGGNGTEGHSKLLKEKEIPVFFSTLVHSWDVLTGLADMGVSDIYIVEELGFELASAAAVLHERGIQIRCYPNVAQSAHPDVPDIKKFFIRPEDVELYEQYVDVFEFYGDNNNLYYKIYAKDKKWFGDLSEIIFHFDKNLDSRCVVPQFAEVRSRCGKKCMKGSPCRICEKVDRLAGTMQENGLYFKKIQETEIDNE